MTLNPNLNYFSISGLIIDIIGVILLFYYGPPNRHKEPEPYAGSDLSEVDLKNNKKIYYKSITGLYLLVLGFVFQLLGCVFVT
jgi:hypothetical protein